MDPGTRTTGWGLIEAAGGKLQKVHWGLLAGKRHASRAATLAGLSNDLLALLRSWEPQVVALETPFVARYVGASLHLAETRGALLAALGCWGGSVVEYEPARVKAWVVGHGRAAKGQVAWMVERFLQLGETPPPDAADALAVALCHLFEMQALSGQTPVSARGLRVDGLL